MNKSILAKRPRAAQSGFTLIEVLLVVVIIGILVAVVAPRLGGRVGESQVSAAKQSMDAIRLAVDMYEVDNGYYPASLQNLITKGSEQNWRGPYIRSGTLPKDPWQREFIYSRSDTSFEIRSMGPDGADGSADDVKVN